VKCLTLLLSGLHGHLEQATCSYTCSLILSVQLGKHVAVARQLKIMQLPVCSAGCHWEVNKLWSITAVVQVVADHEYSKAADVYSFGIIMWEMMTWDMPWEQLNPFQV